MSLRQSAFAVVSLCGGWQREGRGGTYNFVLDIATGTAASADNDAIGILAVEIEGDGRVVELDGGLVEARGHDGWSDCAGGAGARRARLSR